MEILQTEIPEVLIIKPRVFTDDRGFFYESFNRRSWLDAVGVECDFVQDNHSRSCKGVLRGLHYQLPPAAQGKLVRVLVGEIFDVAVDIRKGSPTFGQWVGQKLSAENKLQMWIPQGFAHGFLTLSDVTEVLYKTTDYYAPEHERCIVWDDDAISIKWPIEVNPSLSTKDLDAPRLADSEIFE